jgi:hypothetical protein
MPTQHKREPVIFTAEEHATLRAEQRELEIKSFSNFIRFRLGFPALHPGAPVGNLNAVGGGARQIEAKKPQKAKRK